MRFIVGGKLMYNIIFLIINLLGGMGLFLYGMKLMGDGLENAAGDKLKGIFDRITSNPVKGVLTGTIVTAIIQSSSATTVMIVGFVNAGLMNLYQATSVIMGANIGTTITAQLITFKFDAFAPVFLAIGAVMILFCNKRKVKEVGQIVLGFGILFLGLKLMSSAMLPLKESVFFTKIRGTYYIWTFNRNDDDSCTSELISFYRYTCSISIYRKFTINCSNTNIIR